MALLRETKRNKEMKCSLPSNTIEYCTYCRTINIKLRACYWPRKMLTSFFLPMENSHKWSSNSFSCSQRSCKRVGEMTPTGAPNFPLPKQSALEATRWLGSSCGFISYILCVSDVPFSKDAEPGGGRVCLQDFWALFCYLTQTIQ